MTTPWEDDLVQFARLLCEIRAAVDVSSEERDALCESMDLDYVHIELLFDRADAVWEAAKVRRMR